MSMSLLKTTTKLNFLKTISTLSVWPSLLFFQTDTERFFKFFSKYYLERPKIIMQKSIKFVLNDGHNCCILELALI